MRFHVVMGKTFSDLMSFKRIAIVVVLGLFLTLLLSGTVWRETFQAQGMPLEMQTHYLVGYFMILTFMWMSGFYLAYLISTTGQDLITKEESEGTLLLMVSKPISRFQFILGKFLGLLLSTMVLELVILFGSAVVFWGLLGLDPDTLSAVLRLVPWMFLYSIIVIILFDAITIAISTLFKGRVVITMILTAIIAFTFFAGMVVRLVKPDVYEDYRLYYVDGAHHLGNSYLLLLEQASDGQIPPQSQALLGIFTGTYEAGLERVLTSFLGMASSFDPEIGAMPPSLERTNYISPALSMVLLLAVSGAALGVGAVAIQRKEVH